MSMNMTPSQASACRTLTNRLQRRRHDGNLTFKVEPAVDRAIMLSATNTDSLRWFETHVFVLTFIGPRGGIKISAAEGINAS